MSKKTNEKAAILKCCSQRCEIFQEETLNCPSCIRASPCWSMEKEKQTFNDKIVSFWILLFCLVEYMLRSKKTEACTTEDLYSCKAQHWFLYSYLASRMLSHKHSASFYAVTSNLLWTKVAMPVLEDRKVWEKEDISHGFYFKSQAHLFSLPHCCHILTYCTQCESIQFPHTHSSKADDRD